MRLSFLYGIPFGRWIQLLWENGFRVSPRYAGSALRISGYSLASSGFHLLEKILCRSRGDVVAHPPLFVLGHWRAGTTHLHYLLAQDSRFAFPTVFDTAFPHSFLLWPERRRSILEPLIKNKRPQDNIHVDMGSPSEDDMAMAVLSPWAFYNAWSFPRHYDRYARGLSFRNVPDKAVEAWKRHHHAFHDRLVRRYDRPILFKSPGHTARMRLLLQMYPNARFVHITRHPYQLVRSNLHLFDIWREHYAFLQRPNLADLEERILESCRTMYDAFYEDLPEIPQDRICHVQFEDLERDALAELRRIYGDLGLPPFEVAEPRVKAYLESLAGYQKNELRSLGEAQQARIQSALGREIEAWGYTP